MAGAIDLNNHEEIEKIRQNDKLQEWLNQTPSRRELFNILSLLSAKIDTLELAQAYSQSIDKENIENAVQSILLKNKLSVAGIQKDKLNEMHSQFEAGIRKV